MAWIEQTKKASGKSGGPQYYLQEINSHNKAVLRQFGKRPVRLWTPYGVIDSGLTAVSSAVGSVGHDRLQTGGRSVQNIADQIAVWFGLNSADIETIEFEDSFDHDSFVIKPKYVKLFAEEGQRTLYPDHQPLTLVSNHRSALLMDHLMRVKRRKNRLGWLRSQLRGVLDDHTRGVRSIRALDLLRCSGALDLLGVRLGLCRRGGTVCPEGTFKIEQFPEYSCPIHLAEKSQRFLAECHDDHREQRVVVLCVTHNAPTTPGGYVDVIELRELCRVLDEAV